MSTDGYIRTKFCISFNCHHLKIYKLTILHMIIIKRSGKEVEYSDEKIYNAIVKANNSVPDEHKLADDKIKSIVERISNYSKKLERAMTVEEIQDKVEEELVKNKAYLVSKNYIVYRYKKSIMRKKGSLDKKILSLVECENEDVMQENANKNPVIASTQRDYIAGEISRDITNRLLLPNDVVEAHKEGLIHFHDADYFVNHIHNCCLVDIEDMFQNGTVISKALIEKPKSFRTACTILTQVIAQVASNQYGGQSVALAALAPFVDISRQRIKARFEKAFTDAGMQVSEEKLDSIVNEQLKSDIKQGVQCINYQVTTLMTTNGQAPFITFFMYLNAAKNEQEKSDLALIIEEFLKQRIQGIKNENGVWIAPAFPKLIYVLQEDNAIEGSKYWYLTKLAAECSTKRLVPDYISEKVMKRQKVDELGEGHCFGVMGCRSALNPYRENYDIELDVSIEEASAILPELENKEYVVKRFNGKTKTVKPQYVKIDERENKVVAHFSFPVYEGRFNQGVVTINLPYVALLANKDINEFWKLLDEKIEICHRGLQARHNRLKGTKSDISPIHWQHGALARLKPGEVIDPLLYGSYSTISLGYAGLWECVYALIGKKLTEPEGEELGKAVMSRLNGYCDKWKAEENIGYSLYGTPIESGTYKFAKALQKRFGKIEGVSDHTYITNSYHVNVREPINAFEKLALEAKFQELSPGGAISYIETANMQNNLPAILEVIKFIYNNIMYAEINTYSDHCGCCGYEGEIKLIKNQHGKLVWNCPNCGCEDINKMNILRRVCGYCLQANHSNQGRLGDIHDRVTHI